MEKQYTVSACILKALGLKRPPAIFLAGNRRFRVKFAMPRVHSIMKPRIRIVQGKLQAKICQMKVVSGVWDIPYLGNESPSRDWKHRAASGGP